MPRRSLRDGVARGIYASELVGETYNKENMKYRAVAVFFYFKIDIDCC